MAVQHSENEIRTYLCPDCALCGVKGEPLYQDLKDRLFGVPGKWNLKKCPNPDCGLIWLDPMPLEEDIGKAYIRYYTHQDASQHYNALKGLLKYLFRFAQEGYWANK